MYTSCFSTPQINNWCSDWIEFYAEHRLGYQLNLAMEIFGDSAIYEKALYGWFTWLSGYNYVLILLVLKDGHNEAKFGMSWCAGFGTSFYDSYFQVMPKQVGFHTRIGVYKLYHYLNHYNLFGSGYRSPAMSIIDDYLRMLGIIVYSLQNIIVYSYDIFRHHRFMYF
ncbi:hypothetical protein ZOSMA_237G00250 [Zostera marina]|uniref:Uncharacterized protein n=1 Tax=Zostera marina TaxID=29655 RepID=A0A0K9PHV5_ZOSMR|nr:hypothetical protein ZOSMA_237G00250 [Zostera marina]